MNNRILSFTGIRLEKLNKCLKTIAVRFLSTDTSVKMDFSSVVKKLDTFGKLKLAESWDNVGLLLEPPQLKNKPISKIFLTNDLTLDVLFEAQHHKVNFILSYHPPIFQPLKRITTTHWKQRIIGTCLSEGIAIYSPHTVYDALKGGVADWLISPFEGVCTPVEQTYENQEWTHAISICDSDVKGPAVMDLMQNKPHLATRVFHGNQILCCLNDIPEIAEALGTHSTHMTITKLEKVPLFGHGMGRTTILHKPITLLDAVKCLKELTGLQHVRLAVKHGGSVDSVVQSVSVCVGAGYSILSKVRSNLIVTGEMSHHQVLDFTQQGQNVILLEHSNSERGFLKVLKAKLDDLFEGQIAIIISETDRDPIEVV